MDKEKVLNLAKLARVELRDEEAESLSTDNYLVRAKWSKILSFGKRNYIQYRQIN